MPQIVLTDDQARVVTQATEPVELRDVKGRLIACLPLPLEAEIAEIRRRLASNQRRWPAAKVESLLAELDEIRNREGMDADRLQAMLARFRASNPA